MKDEKPNWPIWLNMPAINSAEAVALSYNRAPGTIDESRPGIAGHKDRMTLYRRCHSSRLTPRAFAEWAQSVGWNIPLALAALAPLPPQAWPLLPDDEVLAALADVVADGGSAAALRCAIEANGGKFVVANGEPSLLIDDGTVQGRIEPLTRLYSALCNMPRSDADKLIRGSGACGSGAIGGSTITASIRKPDAIVVKDTAPPAATSGAPEKGTPHAPMKSRNLLPAGVPAAEIIEKFKLGDAWAEKLRHIDRYPFLKVSGALMQQGCRKSATSKGMPNLFNPVKFAEMLIEREGKMAQQMKRVIESRFSLWQDEWDAAQAIDAPDEWDE